MKKIIRQIVFSIVLLGNMGNAVCGTMKQEQVEQKRHDIKAARFGVREKIALAIGLATLCYIYYSWRGVLGG